MVRIRFPPAESRTNSGTRLRLQNKPASGHAIPHRTVSSVLLRGKWFGRRVSRELCQGIDYNQLISDATIILDQVA